MQRQTVDESPLPLVLIPGTLCDGRIFEPLLERLPPLVSALVLTPRARTMAEAADEVLAQAPPAFALLGFSLGGMVAMETALRAPDRVHGLALISTTPRPVPVELHAARRAAAVQAGTQTMGQFMEQQLWPGYGCQAPERQWLPLLKNMAELVGPAAYRLQTELALGREDFRPRLCGVGCPTLIAAGDQDQLCPPAAQDELVAAIPNATRLVLRGAGHLAILERPDEIAQGVAAWLETSNRVQVRRNNFLPGPTRSKEHG